MAFVVWLTSTGVVLAIHTCQASQSVDVSFFRPEGCCSDDLTPCGSATEKGTTLAEDCCSLEMDYQKVQVVSAGHRTVLPVVASSTMVLHFLPLHGAVVFTPDSRSTSYKGPPPRGTTTSDFLFSIHRLLI